MKRKLVPNMLTKDIPAVIARELKVRPKQVEAAIGLLDDGNTVPFIARYRKEATGSLEDEQLRSLEERLTYLRNIVKRQEDIIGKIEEQGKLTSELRSGCSALASSAARCSSAAVRVCMAGVGSCKRSSNARYVNK